MIHATDLHALADRLERLAPSHRDPHRYFEEKSEIVAELRRLATLPTRMVPPPANDNHPRRTAA
ncbi:hypothetical protein P9A16_07130 [Shinella sp. 838]|uniref:hypothetical protein n=1 Tax=Shinella sp. 838 TaxID=3038164 RepID=UPI002414E0DD|nr:hypothetical protein [Shinella sp. 838]MDG4670890.1 hypothetical protein [Shinella sp. 838]